MNIRTVMTITPSDIAELKSRHRLSDIVARHVKLRRSGREYVGLCPFHEESSASFYVNDAKGLYHCFACAASGDAIDFVREIEGKTFVETLEWLGATDLSTGLDPAWQEREQRRETARKLASVARAHEQWAAVRPIAGTLGARYMRSRGIVGPIPPDIGFAWVPLWYNRKTGRPGPARPAVLCACRDVHGDITGLQRIFLDRSGNKAAMKKPKLSLGHVRGSAVRLGPPARRIILCEGPEDGLTLWMRYPTTSVWVTLGTGSLPHVILPSVVQDVVLGGDNNIPGRAAVATAHETYTAQGRNVRDLFPAAEFEDFNDEHLGIHMASVG